MNRDELERLRSTLSGQQGPRPAPDTPECLSEDRLARIAAGTVGPGTRAQALAHLAACPRCRDAVASVARALADPSVAKEIDALEHGWWYRYRRVAVPLAAAAALVLLIALPRLPEMRVTHRAPTITGSAAPAPVSPAGAVAVVDRLTWTPVAGADRYRVILFGADGAVLYETQLGDTVAVVPDSVTLVPDRPYLWKVEARTGYDRWSASELIEFRIAPVGRR